MEENHQKENLRKENLQYDPGGDRHLTPPVIMDDEIIDKIIEEVKRDMEGLGRNTILNNIPVIAPSPIIEKFSDVPKATLIELSKLFWLPKKINMNNNNYVNADTHIVPTHSWFNMNNIIQKPENNNLPFMTFNSITVVDSIDKSTNKLLTSQQIIDRDRERKIKEQKNKSDKHKEKEKDLPKNKKYNKKQKIRKPKKEVIYDPNKKGCNYIVTQKFNDIMYGRCCNDLCEGDKTLCKKHIGKRNNNYDQLADNLCKHVITQLSRGKNRKGMYCNNFTFGSPDRRYCTGHCKRHSEINLSETIDTEIRSFKVRFYPNQEQIKKLNIYFGCSRFTYNKCVDDKFRGSFVEGRDKYVTAGGNIYSNEDVPTMSIDYKKVIKNETVHTFVGYPLVKFSDDIDFGLVVINGQSKTKIDKINKELSKDNDIRNFERHNKLVRELDDNNNKKFLYPIKSEGTKGKQIKITNRDISYRYPLKEFDENMRLELINVDHQSKINLDNINKKLFETNIHSFDRYRDLIKSYDENMNRYITYPIRKMKSFVEENTFLVECPKEIRAFAITEYITAIENAERQYKRKVESNEWKKGQNLNNGKKFKIKPAKKPEMKFRTKKEEQCITINKDSVKIENKEIRIYPEMFSKTPLKIGQRSLKKDKKMKEILNRTIQHDVKIYKTNMNTYYLCFSIDIKKQYPVLDKNNMMFCDTGGKTFLKGYKFKELIEAGIEIDKQIIEDIKRIDENKKRRKELYVADKENNKEKIKEKEREHKRLNLKLRNKIKDMQEKTITKLLQTDIIYIPKLNTQQIVEQENYNKLSKRVMNYLKHGAFIRRLIEKASLLGKIVIICSEYLTTKLCDECFEKNECDSRLYECMYCHNKVDRDQHSSKLIFMKQITGIKKDDGSNLQINLL